MQTNTDQAGHHAAPVISKIRRHCARMVAAALLAVWGWLVLGSDLPVLLAALAAVAAAAWVLRRRRDLAATMAVAVGTAAAPTAACLIVMTGQVTGAQDIVAVLTGYILVSPIPALTASLLRPPLVCPWINAMLGSVVLLLGAGPVVIFGDHGYGAALLLLSLTTACGLVWIRHRQAAAALLSPLPTLDGWADLGRRVLPGGTQVDRLLIGQGHVLAASAITGTRAACGVLPALQTAAATAAALGMPGSRVQPVVLVPAMDRPLERHLVNTGDIAASVIVTGSAGLPQVIRLAPHRRGHRRAVLTASSWPTSPERNSSS